MGPGRRWRRPRSRPPWWPEGEPWPPSGPPSWAHGAGRSSRRRARVFLAIMVLVAVAVVNTVLNLFGYLVLPVTTQGKLLAAGFLLVFLILIVIASRTLAGEARQATEAAGRVEKGDFSVRLNERGWGGLGDVARAFNSMSSRLQATETRRRSFLAEVTHELRTPLAIIRGEAEAITDGVHTADPEHMGRILTAARTVERLVEDLGTLSLGDAGGLILRREPVDLEVLINESISDLKPAAEAAGVALEPELAEGLPPILLDPARIRGVLGNLFANALRHTPSGGRITVTAARVRNGMAISVEDTGSGIPAGMLPHVFERFVKDPASPGSGLGLAIARDVVAAHLGTIEATSTPGAGTTIKVWLPTS
jgi:two-component system, OmpR family, sensor histidine kinase BaeS